jgi:hypothetical protein
MFKVIFVKTVWDGDAPETSSTMVLLSREATLPVAPVPGIEYFWGLTKPEAPKTIRWDFLKEAFVCVMPDEFPGDGIDDFDFDGLVKYLLDGEWNRVGEPIKL